MKEATGTTSVYLKETFVFLEDTFSNLRVLKMSDQLISDAIFATYQHIGFSLLEKLIDERYQYISTLQIFILYKSLLRRACKVLL